MIVAHADNLHRVVECPLEALDDRRPKFDGPLLPHDVRRIEIADKPLIAAIDPDIHAVLQDNPQGPPGDLGRQEVRRDGGHVGIYENPAIESCDRGAEPQRLDQHRHAARRPATRDRKGDPRRMQRVNGRRRARGQQLVWCDQSAIHIGQDERHAHGGRRSCHQDCSGGALVMGRQLRPSRVKRASASAGPELPAG